MPSDHSPALAGCPRDGEERCQTENTLYNYTFISGGVYVKEEDTQI